MTFHKLDGLELLPAREGGIWRDEDRELHVDAHDRHGHTHGEFDMHIWLDVRDHARPRRHRRGVPRRRLINTVIEGTDVRSGTVDPMGATVDSGPDLYFKLLRNMSSAFRDCLAPSD